MADEVGDRGDGDGNEQPVHMVPGATGGIGSALSRQLADRGAGLYLVARSEEELRELAGEPDGSVVGGRVRMQSLDATDAAAVAAGAEAARDAFGRLDGIANCVGSLLLKPIHLVSPQEWRDTLETNLDSAFAAVRAAARVFDSRRGSVVLTSTAAVRTGLPNHGAIAAAEKSRAMHALGRLGEPGDVASAMAWLLDPRQSWVTGQVLGVDGGLGSARPRIGA